jgi:hypothetical protein
VRGCPGVAYRLNGLGPGPGPGDPQMAVEASGGPAVRASRRRTRTPGTERETGQVRLLASELFTS